MPSLITLMLYLAVGVFHVSATSRPSLPQPPALTYLTTINLTTSTHISVGNEPSGERIVIPFVGGTVSGPKLNGTVAPLGVDWALSISTTDFLVDGKFVIQTIDGANIIFHDRGHAPYALGTFETGFKQHDWLNTVAAVVVVVVVVVVVAQTSAGASLTVFQASSSVSFLIRDFVYSHEERDCDYMPTWYRLDPVNL
ncbi:hypothetical protein QBC46DRAFT_413205 [Diplogelasinospora grovesii]|uniref:Uncharacterized protein n=1 Tax=Diplogelasinospora grovesii TaxID=303347 RepID=A0AAN6MXC8_9PEZI|nr:hypothetical protein QBC46DRAFT_413205 [Diplogelasinospora grovesii]